MKSKISSCSKEELLSMINDSNTINEVLRKIGVLGRGSNHKTFKKKCEKEGIDLSELRSRITEYYKQRPVVVAKSFDDVLVEDSSYSPGSIKRRLLKAGILKNICAECGLGTTWNKKQMTLIMDHINGVHTDNRLENLRMLCPNCHSQTNTYAGRNAIRPVVDPNRKKDNCKLCNKQIGPKTKNQLCVVCSSAMQRRVERPAKEELEQLLKDNTLVALGKKYGVSDNAVRKWMKAYGIVKKRSGSVAQ